MELAMLNDSIVPIEQATNSAHDRGIFFGDGVYEVLRLHKQNLFALDRHKNRLERSLREMEMISSVDCDQLWQRVQKAIEQASIDRAIIYLHITRGQQIRSHDYDETLRPQFFLTVRENHKEYHPTISAISHPDWRWKRCDIKSLNLLPNIMAKHAATKANAYEAVLVNEKGLITEGSCTNVIMIKNGLLKTAPLTENILSGITRSLILDWACEFNLNVKEESFSLKDALDADELMIAGTVTEIRSVVKLDGKQIATGKQGTIAQQLQQKLITAMRK